MSELSYENRRSEIATYFDETAVEAWKKLTSDAPVSRIRATVRAGREETLTTLLSWLPANLKGQRILDAGCGTGLLATQLAGRGADVVAIDLSPKLVDMARERLQPVISTLPGSITFKDGDMLDDALGEFDTIVAMDSLIHYEPADMLQALEKLSARARARILFTFAPRTPMLTVMHKAGKLFPKKDRSPSIVPVAMNKLHKDIDHHLHGWQCGSDHLTDVGFYKSHAQELLRK